MKMYDPIKKNTFVMQFGFWHEKDNRQYHLSKNKKNEKRKSSSNIP
tara:strand:- start:35 stop:172 length:138 start_codon:yes stop_codon:yes gene_type:complete